MRARNIKPGFFKNEVLAQINPLGRILFEGLWCMADREGRLEDRPLRIKGEIFPYEDCDVDSFLNILHEKGFILRYTVNGKNFIHIPKFKNHQNPHHREKPSFIPPPKSLKKLSRTSPGPAQGQAGKRHVPAVLIPDSLIPDSLKKQEEIPEPVDNPKPEASPQLSSCPLGNPKTKTPKSQTPEVPDQKKTPNPIFQKIGLEAKKLEGRWNGFNPYQWIQRHAREESHPEAILKTLQRLNTSSAKDPWAYTESIIKIENQNFNERDSINQGQKNAGIFTELLLDLKKLHGRS